jgi:hypothetical protein
MKHHKILIIPKKNVNKKLVVILEKNKINGITTTKKYTNNEK